MEYLMAEMIPTIYLKPGEIHFSQSPCKVITILGSCVAITMFNRPMAIGAICHAMMPTMLKTTAQRSTFNDFHYVDTAFAWMLAKFVEEGIHTRNLEIKLFGGAGMLAGKTGLEQPLSVGERNINKVFEILDDLGLKLKAWDVGGDKGRKLIFSPHTGEVLVKFVARSQVSQS